MGELKNFRMAMGLSQEEMAGILGIRRAQISMAEAGKRRLPDPALLVFAQLLQTWENLQQQIWQERIPSQSAVDEEIRILETQRDGLKNQLETLLEKEKQFQLLLKLRASAPRISVEKRDIWSQKWWEAVLERMRYQLEPTGPETILCIRAKIIGFEATIRTLKGDG